MLGSNYLTFGGLPLPNPAKFSIGYDNIKNSYEAESGRRLQNVVRAKARTFSCTFNVTSWWQDKILAFCDLEERTLVYRGESITATAEVNDSDLAENTEHVQNTDGLWEVKVIFREV